MNTSLTQKSSIIVPIQCGRDGCKKAAKYGPLGGVPTWCEVHWNPDQNQVDLTLGRSRKRVASEKARSNAAEPDDDDGDGPKAKKRKVSVRLSRSLRSGVRKHSLRCFKQKRTRTCMSDPDHVPFFLIRGASVHLRLAPLVDPFPRRFLRRPTVPERSHQRPRRQPCYQCRRRP